MEKFFTALISGDRPTSRGLLVEALKDAGSSENVLNELFWPTLEHVQKLHRADQLSDLSYNFATRLMRQLIDVVSIRLTRTAPIGRSVLVVSGAEQTEELSAQMSADLLEANGYDVHFLGGGVANDEIVAQLGTMEADVLVVFGAINSTVPQTRLLIDHLHEIGVCPKLQIVVGGGIFNRAEGLAEEIGADLWANTPSELVEVMAENTEQRMQEDQRTVGRKRRSKREAA